MLDMAMNFAFVCNFFELSIDRYIIICYSTLTETISVMSPGGSFGFSFPPSYINCMYYNSLVVEIYIGVLQNSF